MFVQGKCLGNLSSKKPIPNPKDLQWTFWISGCSQPPASSFFFTHVVRCKSHNLLTSCVAKAPLGSVNELAKHFAAKGNLFYKEKLEKKWSVPCAASKILAF